MNWENLLKRDWKPPPREPVVKGKDKIIAYLKRNPQGMPKMSIVNDNGLSVSRVKVYLRELIEEGNVEYVASKHSVGSYAGKDNFVKPVYKWIGE